MLPAAQASSTAGTEAAASARHGTGVDGRDLPAMLRVPTLAEEAVDRTKMEFPGTYNRKGQLIDDAVEGVDAKEQGDGTGDPEDPLEPPDDPLALLEDEFPYLLGK